MMHGEFWNGKTVFVTGHSGFQGSWLSLWLQRLGANVVGYALKPPTSPNLFALADVARHMVSVTGDIRDRSRLASAMQGHQPDIVFHLAAQPLVRASYRDPVDTYSTNVLGTVHLLDVVRQTPSVRVVVNVTTDKCYQNKEWVWGYREQDPLGGHDPYSNSKACSELVTQAFRDSFFHSASLEHPVAVATARAGNVIGGGDWAEDRLVPDCIRAFLAGGRVSIRYPEAIRPWQHVLEPLAGYLVLAEQLFQDGGTYSQAWNFGPDEGEPKSVRWMMESIVRLWGEAATWDVDPRKHPPEAQSLRLDSSKARTQLGWKPRWTIETALTKTIEWYKAYQTAPEKMREITLRHIGEYAHPSSLVETSDAILLSAGEAP